MLRKGEKIGEYVLLDKVGSGGFGDVWKAEKRTRVDVNHFALKFFRPKDDSIDFDKISKEVNVWKQLRGLPHIISVIELDQFDDYIYVVSDFADGGSLEKWLKNNGKASSVEEAVKITLEILTGLEKLHEKGFVHRDIKPDNILITNGSHCLADFGISREVKSHSKATSTAGTMEYMPPEAFARNASITKQTDIWAVGVILQKLLTGKLPYPQDDQPSLIAAILYSEPEKMPASIPGVFHEVVDKALQKKREDRYPTAMAMSKAVQAALLEYHNEQAAPVTKPAISPLETVEFNDLETIRIEKPDLGENPTVEIKRFVPGPSVATKEFVIDRQEIVPAAAAAAAPPPPVKNTRPLWMAAALVLGVLTVAGVGGVMWFNNSTAGNSNSGTVNSAAPVSTPTPTPAPAPEYDLKAADAPLPKVSPSPSAPVSSTPASKNIVVGREKPRPENTPVKPAATPPKVKKTPEPDPRCIFTKCP